MYEIYYLPYIFKCGLQVQITLLMKVFFYTNYSSYTQYNCIKNGATKLPEEHANFNMVISKHANFEEFTFKM